MTLDEIATSFPNGFHDAIVYEIAIDYFQHEARNSGEFRGRRTELIDFFPFTFFSKERWTFKKSGKFDFLKVHQE